MLGTWPHFKGCAMAPSSGQNMRNWRFCKTTVPVATSRVRPVPATGDVRRSRGPLGQCSGLTRAEPADRLSSGADSVTMAMKAQAPPHVPRRLWLNWCCRVICWFLHSLVHVPPPPHVPPGFFFGSWLWSKGPTTGRASRFHDD